MRRTSLALAVVVIALVVFGSGSAVAYPVAHVDPQSRGAVASYWTAEKMQQATPAERDSRPGAASKPAKRRWR